MIKLKKIIFFVIVLSIVFISYLFYLHKFEEEKLKNYVRKYVWPNVSLKVQAIVKIIYKDKYAKQFFNDYNVKFIPETQTNFLDLKKNNLEFLTGARGIYNKQTYRKSFFIELYNQDILITDIKGNFYYLAKKPLINNDISSKNYFGVPSNLNPFQVLDTLIIDEKLFVSFVNKKENCHLLNIYFTEINYKGLDFKHFFSSTECMNTIIQGGRLQPYSLLNQPGILLTVGDSSTPDNLGGDAQDDNSIYGKIIFKSFEENKRHVIFSKGHRNPQGLFVENNLILSTEHGPRGGDEINKIEFQKNYGWPIASYGNSYFDKSIVYKNSHKKNNFKEPIFSFIPSIGISELIKIENNFDKAWEDNFIVSSLNDESLYRIKFSDDYSKIIFSEKIFIGERIRDLKYDNESKCIVLALETNGNISFLCKKDI